MIRRILKIIVRTFAITILLILIAGVFLTTTQTGLRLSIDMISKFIPDTLHIKKTSGYLLKKITLSGITYKDSNTTLFIKNINFVWHPLALFSGRLNIGKLHITSARLNLLEHKSHKKNRSKISDLQHKKFLPPIQITANDIDLTDTTIISGNSKHHIQHITLQAKTENDSLKIKKFSSTLTPYTVTLSGSIQLQSPFQTKLKGTVLIDKTNMPIQFNLSGSLKHQISLQASSKTPHTINLSALIKQPLKLGSINIQAQWQNIVLPISKHNKIKSKKGNIKLSGKLNAYKLHLHTDIANHNIPNSLFELAGSGSLTHLHLPHVFIQTLDGKLSGSLTLDWKNRLNWKTTLQGENLDPSIQWGKWPGNISFALHSQGQLQNNLLPSGKINLSLQGKLRQKFLSGNLQGDIVKKYLDIKKGIFTFGNNTLTIHGILNNKLDLKWNLNARDLSEIFPEAIGSIQSKGIIKGTRKIPYIQGELTTKKCAFYDLSLKNLSASANIHFNSHGILNVSLSGNDLEYKRFKIKTLNSKLTGFVNKHQLKANIITKNTNFDILTDGSYKNKTLSEKLKKLDLHSKIYQNWSLTNAVPLLLTTNKILISPFCWQSSSAKLCGQINLHKLAASSISLNAKNIPLALFTQLLPLQIDTKLNLDLSLKKDNQGKIIGHANFQNSPGTITYDKQPNTVFKFDSSYLSSILSQKGLFSRLKINVPGHPPIQAHLNLPGYQADKLPKPSQPIDGHLSLTLNHLTMLQDFIPQITNTNGHFQADFNIDGSIGKPKVTGKASISQARTTIAPLGITLKQINITAHSSNHQTINFTGNAVSGQGKLNITGETFLMPPLFKSAFKITGDNLQAANTPEYKIVISPDVMLAYEKPKLTLSGNINVLSASIKPKDFSEVVTLPDNIIIINGYDKNKRLSLFDFYMDLAVALGDNINFAYTGLETQLGGDLTLFIRPEQLPTAIGQLNVIKGKYEAYGEKLNIQRGSLIFTGGPLENPGLNIIASKRIQHIMTASVPLSTKNLRNHPHLISGVENLTVGLDITGTLNEPQINLFSIPATLDDTDILSYLVLDVPSTNATGMQAQLLFKSAQAIGIAGANILNDIQSTFGLTEFGIEPSTTLDTKTHTLEKTSAFVIGKYITPRLYMNYSVGILSPVNTLQLKYFFAKRWTLQTATSTLGNSADLFYTIETD